MKNREKQPIPPAPTPAPNPNPEVLPSPIPSGVVLGGEGIRGEVAGCPTGVSEPVEAVPDGEDQSRAGAPADCDE